MPRPGDPDVQGRDVLARVRRAWSGGFYYLATGGLARLLQFLLVPLITHLVQPRVFGQYALIRVALFLFKTLSDLGTGAATVRYGTGVAGDQQSVFASAWWGRFTLAIVLSALVLSVGGLLLPNLLLVVALSVTAFFMLSVTDALATIARAQERHSLVAGAHLAGAVLEALSVVILLWRYDLGLVGLSASLALRFSFTFAIHLARRTAPLKSPTLARFGALLRFGIPAAFGQLVSTLGAMDRWLIERLSSLASVASYHLASVPAVGIEVLEQAVVQAAEPWVYGAPSAERERALARLARLYFVVTITAALAASCLAPEILALLAPPSYAAALPAMPWLVFAAVMQGGTRIVGIGSGLAHQTRPWAIAGALDLCLSAGLIVALLPYGVGWAAAARFVAATVGVLVCHGLSQRVSGLRIPGRGYVLWGVAIATFASVLLTVVGAGLALRIGLLLAVSAGTLAITLPFNRE